MIACAAMPAGGVCTEPSEAPAAAGAVADVAAPPPNTDGDLAEREGRAATGRSGADEHAPPPATDGDRAKLDKEAAAVTPKSQVEKTATPEVGGAINSICLILESAATAKGLPLEFFARVIWQESQFQPNTVGPMTRGGHRAQGIAQFMPYTAAQRGLLDPFNPQTALPQAAEFLAELRSEFGNLGLAAAAYNAGPGRVRNFIGRRGGLPAQTRHYVRATTGRSVEEWAALGHQGGKDGIAKPTSCRQLASVLKEQPDFSIGTVERKVHEATLRAQGIPDWPNASSGESGASRVAARPTESLAAPIETLSRSYCRHSGCPSRNRTHQSHQASPRVCRERRIQDNRLLLQL